MNKNHYIILILLFLFLALVCCWAIYGNIGLILEVEAQENVIIPPPANPNDTFLEIEPYPKEEYKSYIRLVARNYGVDEILALRIANVESEFRNVCNSGGCIYGIGVFQIVQSTFDEAVEKMYVDYSELGYELSGISPYNIKDNIDVAIYMMSRGEYWRWNASKSCWKY